MVGTCLSCKPGFYTPVERGARECLACPSGKYSSVPGMQCMTCPSGTVSSAMARACRPCRPGFYSPDHGSSRYLMRHALFPLVPYDGISLYISLLSRCSGCAAGTYSVESGSVECVHCALGRYQGATGKKSCHPCPAGSYADTLGSSRCILCPSGKAQFREKQNNCDFCTPGRFYPATGGVDCIDWCVFICIISPEGRTKVFDRTSCLWFPLIISVSVPQASIPRTGICHKA